MTERRAKTLVLQQVTKSFGGVYALRRVDAVFEPGIVTCIIGSNGAGKTTLLGVCSGFVAPDHGEVTYDGRRIERLSPHRIARLGVGRLFQDVRLFHHLSVLENVAVADQESRGEHPIAALLWPLIGGHHERENLLRARRHLDFVGLADRADQPSEHLSFGQQKLLAIARLRNSNVQCMLLDEPTSGLSPTMVSRMISAIRALAEEDRTIIVVEHNLAVVRELASWVYVMEDGVIKARLSPGEIEGDTILGALTNVADGTAPSATPAPE